ncbi:UNVERIFIED_CONTAM: hypothetical protein K2H54_068445 [Gekko kuhli]
MGRSNGVRLKTKSTAVQPLKSFLKQAKGEAKQSSDASDSKMDAATGMQASEHSPSIKNVPPDALHIRRVLKPITQKLTESGIRYRWLQSGYLQVKHQGTVLKADDLDTGTDMLRALGLDLPREPQLLQLGKRKREIPGTPHRWSKIPVRLPMTP